jgi:hypothetical protein
MRNGYWRVRQTRRDTVYRLLYIIHVKKKWINNIENWIPLKYDDQMFFLKV